MVFLLAWRVCEQGELFEMEVHRFQMGTLKIEICCLLLPVVNRRYWGWPSLFLRRWVSFLSWVQVLLLMPFELFKL